ncbi:MAG: MBL fold metallo-hydrolase [Clostridia bacterium]|nr:MBL fold metallo-hydrolase [Clostridia bacterium]
MNRKDNAKQQMLIRALIFIAILIVYLVMQGDLFPSDGYNSPAPTAGPSLWNSDGPTMEVHYIDVGQADSILVSVEGEHMLIDAGNNEDEDLVLQYLAEQGVTSLRYVVGTHPHEDHIGALDGVILNMDVEKVLMPKVSANTQTYENVLKAVKKKKLKVTAAVPGDTYELGSAVVTVLGPVKKYDDLNDWSIVLRVEYGARSFLFCADAERPALQDILNTGRTVASDVIKMGHHGSSSSAYDKFLEAVNPTWAVITCETGNDYNHPHIETVEWLKENQILLFRTDKQGHVAAITDGQTIEWNMEPTDDYSRGIIK